MVRVDSMGSDEENDEESARTFRVVIRGGTAVSALVLLASILNAPSPPLRHAGYLTLVLVHLAALALVRAGWRRTAVASFAVVYLAIVAFQMYLMGGLRAPAAIVFLPLILLVGFSWSGRAALATGAVCAAVSALFVWGEVRGRLPPPIAEPSPGLLWVVSTACLVVTATILHVALGNIARSRARARAAEIARLDMQAAAAEMRRLESIGKIATEIAHDFNNLLTVIIGEASVIPRSDPRAAAAAAAIQAAGGRGASLVRRLLAYARREPSRPQRLDINGIVRELETLMRAMVGEGVTLRLALASPLDAVYVDRAQLDQVILNLVANARDAVAGHGTVTITTAMAADPAAPDNNRRVVLAISDDGVGIDEATRPHVFEPFFTTKSSERGTGLGLAVVQSIVAQSGGSIDLSSQPGVGSTFAISLPSAEPVGPPGPVAQPAPTPPGPLPW